MPGFFHHEEIYRGRDPLARLAAVPVTLCGAGAVGSLLADNLARQGFGRWTIIDRDRVEPHNVGTQLYGESDVGAWKVDALRSRLFRSVGIEVAAVARELTGRTAGNLLNGSTLVVDAFDNSRVRRHVQDYCRRQGVRCVHVGLSAAYAEIIWDEHYRVPDDVAGDTCEYPLARNLVLLAVALASEVLVRHALDGTRDDWSITLGDFAVRPMTPRSA